MPRRFFLAALVAGAAVLGVYWWLTATPIVLAVTAPAYAPNLANGLTAFNAGGCSSCHAMPGQPDRLTLGGGLAIPSPFGTFYAPNISPYLVNSLGHCAECHSPRNLLGGIIAAQRFAGGPNPEGEGWVPNITQKGPSEWSDKDIAYFLETGQTPDGDTAGGAMVRVIKNTSQLAPEDRAAIAEYIKSLPPVDGPPRPKKAKKDDDKS